MSVLFDKWENQPIVTEQLNKPVEIEPVKFERLDTEIPHKAKVLLFMRRAEILAVAPMMYNDRETGKPAIEAYYQKAGNYIWSSDTLYHFEKYNYTLPQEFIEYVLTENNRMR